LKTELNFTLIYDKTDVLTNQVRHYCGANIDVLFIDSENSIYKVNLDYVNVAYVRTNDLNDLHEILEIQKKAVFVFIDTNSVKIKNRLKKGNNVQFFNSVKDRYEIMTNVFNNTIS
jgi:hypothetical protein